MMSLMLYSTIWIGKTFIEVKNDIIPYFLIARSNHGFILLRRGGADLKDLDDSHGTNL